MTTADSAATFAGPYRPFALRVANAVGAILPSRPRLTVESILAATRIDGARLDAPEDAAFVERLEALLADANRAGQLNHVGRWIVRAKLARIVANRLRVRQWVREHPATRDVALSTPLFIVGQPRTGTTLLYALLAQDPQARAPRVWEVNAPVPPPLPDGGRDDARYKRCRDDIARTMKYVPALAVAHDIGVDDPDECYPLLEASMLSPTFSLYFDIPAYWQRLKAATPGEVTQGYAFYREQLQVLLARSEGRRWVSKSPAHLCFLEGLASAFPDAHIVETHRDPLESIPSACSLTAIIRSASSDRVEPYRVGDATLDWFCEAERRSARARETLPAERFVDIAYERLIADPIGVVRDLYARCGLPLTRLAERRMSDWLATNPQHRHGVHRYSLAQFGLGEERVRAATADYRARYLSCT
jgi:hypothetical protein